MPVRPLRQICLPAAVLAVVAVCLGSVTAVAAPAPTPSPVPTRPAAITRPGGLEPNQVAPLVSSQIHIVKDTNDADPSCTGYKSQSTPPSTIRVALTASNTVVTVNFETYVENVLPNEWIPSWDSASLQAGAVAAKSYAWFWVNHFGGYVGSTNTPSTCFDVTDDTNFQVYRANSAQASTTGAVQQTWSTIARNADTHTIRQTFYRAELASHTSGHDTCGQGANGSTMSQWGSQACAVAGKTYQQILATYYFQTASDPALELATATLGPPSAVPFGPAVLSSLGTLAAYHTAGGNVLGAGQNSSGVWGTWTTINRGPSFIGQPTALIAANGTVVLYALSTTGHVLGDGQSRVGGSFSGWRTIGSGSPSLVSDPLVLMAKSGAIVMYAIASDGNVWGVGQSTPGQPFGSWVRLSSGGGFFGKPTGLVTGSGLLVIYARNGNIIEGNGQSVAGGVFNGFARIGSGTPGATGDPSVIQVGDGTLAVFAGGAPGTTSGIWITSQPAPGKGFGAWQQISSSSSFVSGVAAHAMSSTGPVVAYAVAGTAVRGAQADTPASVFSNFGTIGSGTQQAIGEPSMVLASNGALNLFVIGSDGGLWTVAQPRPGATFGGWSEIGA